MVPSLKDETYHHITYLKIFKHQSKLQREMYTILILGHSYGKEK